MERTVERVYFPGYALPKPKRVAAYARVSTGKDAMLHSLSAQVSYYSQLIQNHPGWHYVGVYADEAMTGTKQDREQFQRLMHDCRAGKIDMVITKSISRFSRNTITLLENTRELKALGVDVFFEEQNIHTMSGDGELMLTILASYAQEESLSASENQKWRIRKCFENGEIVNLRFMFGYNIRKGSITVNPIEAKIVREVFQRFVAGETLGSIAADLNTRKITGRFNGEWKAKRIKDIVSNEKYLGHALLQKQFTVDFLQKKMKVNEGEVPQYYVEHSHEAIIAPDEWERVQAEMRRRRSSGKNHNCNSPFSAKLICGDCGEYYGSKVWHSNSKYRSIIWQCNAKFRGDRKCTTPHLREDQIQACFISALSKLYADRESILDTCRPMQSALTDNTIIDAELADIRSEMDVIAGLIRSCIVENATQRMDQTSYQVRYNSYVDRYEKLKERYTDLQKQHDENEEKAIQIGGFMFELSELEELPISFDERLWNDMIDSVVVYEDEKLVFRFQNGHNVTILM